MTIMGYTVHADLQAPIDRGLSGPARAGRKILGLLDLARMLPAGHCVELSLAETQTFRIILMAQGYHCRTDGWRCKTRGKVLVFKIAK